MKVRVRIFGSKTSDLSDSFVVGRVQEELERCLRGYFYSTGDTKQDAIENIKKEWEDREDTFAIFEVSVDISVDKVGRVDVYKTLKIEELPLN